jgi:uncharacterized protein YbbK (DUF523 family)
MTDFLTCADNAISEFVRDQIGSPPWPNWAGLIPGDTQNGWGASVASWRQQADAIMSAFEECAGVRIPRVRTHIDKLRRRTLTTFRDYMVEQAEVVAAADAAVEAQAALKSAKQNLQTVRSL